MSRRGFLTFGAAAAVFAPIGCNPASLSYFLFKGDGTAPAQFPLKPKNDKREVHVAILVTAPANQFEFAGLERELATAIGRSMFELTKGKKPIIRTIEQSSIDKYKSENPGWRTVRAADIGKAVGADYALDASVTSISLYDREIGRLMYQGRSTIEAKMYDCDTGSQHAEYYVDTKMDQKPSDDIPVGQYRSMLIQRMGRDVSWKHVPHVSDQRVAGASQ